MKYYYKKIDSNGATEMLLTYDYVKPNITHPFIVEITKDEYYTLIAEIEAANQPEESETDEISDSEALAIILGGEA